MQATIEDLSSVKKKLHIEIPAEDIARELDNAYGTLKKTSKIKGFRPGKVPRSVLERLFKKDVFADVSSKLIESSLLEAVKEKDLKVVGKPKIDSRPFDGEGTYSYEVTLEVKPPIGPIDFKGISIKKNVYSIRDEEVNAQLKMFQKHLARKEKVEEDRPVAEGDFVLIDYEGFKDGAPHPEIGLTENFMLNVGEGSILREFELGIVGMKPGDRKEIIVRYPEDHVNAKLAGQELAIRVLVKEIRKEILPEIDDEMAKKLGNYETLEDLKAAVRKNLQEGYDKRQEQEINEQIFSALIAKADFEVPEAMIEMELEAILREAEMAFSYRNLTLEEMGHTREKLAEKYRPTAEKQVRRHLILDKVVEQENLTLSDEALENGFRQMALAFNQPIEEIKKFYRESDDKLDYFKHTLLEKEAIKLIIDNSSVEDVEAVAATPDETDA